MRRLDNMSKGPWKIKNPDGLKELAFAVVEDAIKDYRKAKTNFERKQIRQDMKNNIWLDILDTDYDFEEIANIIDLQNKKAGEDDGKDNRND